MTTYISGPMSGHPDLNFPAFNDAARALRFAGLDVVNPADHGIIDGFEWSDYLRADIKALMDCDSILMLDGWMQSRGARLERHIAVELGMPVYYSLTEALESQGVAA